MTAANRILLLSFVIVLGSHTLFSRGMGHDGVQKLLEMILKNNFVFFESNRIIFDIFCQLPAWLFIKFSSFSSLSILTILYSFGLVWVHIISLVGCFLILPTDKKKLIFFPLFGFLVGPLPALGVSVSVALSICSYVWLVAFIIYYSELSIWRHRLFFSLAPLPLILSHELISYMAFPLIALCILKYKKESGFLNKALIAGSICVLSVSAVLAFRFLFFDTYTIGNSLDFISALTKFGFIFSSKTLNFPVIVSLCLIVFLGLQSISFKDYIKKISFALFLLIFSFAGLVIFPPSALDNFLRWGADEFATRVWPPCFALPLSLGLWWFLKGKEISFTPPHKWFLLSLLTAAIALTLWSAQSDLKFYKHQKEFSKALSAFQGIIEWPDAKDIFQNITLKNRIDWQMTEASILYPRSRVINAVLIMSYSYCKSGCEGCPSNQPVDCDSICRRRALGICEEGFGHLSNNRFFDFSLLESCKNCACSGPPSLNSGEGK